jgi:hypothetical protein
MSDHYAVTYPNAARPHRCGECCGAIAKGQSYARHVSITSDGVDTHRICIDCQRWADALEDANRALGRWGISFGEDDSSWLWGSLWAAIGEFWRECLAPEAVACREREEARMRHIVPRVGELGASR